MSPPSECVECGRPNDPRAERCLRCANAARHRGKRGPEAPGYRGTPEERFWAFVAEPDENGCRIWQGAIDCAGYGRFGLTGTRTVLAHRFSYELTRAPVLDGQCVHHRCKSRACVEPDHLQPVTRALHNRLHFAGRKAA